MSTSATAPLNEWLGLDQVDGAEKAQRVEALKSAWQGTMEKTLRGAGPKPAAGKYASIAQTRPYSPEQAQHSELAKIVDLEKTLGADTLASMADTIARAKVQMADLEKAWSFSNPSPLPLPYDLLPVIQSLVNRKTPLYDRIPTGQANGIAHHYFQLTGYSNTGMAGLSDVFSGISSDSVSNSFGPVNLRRGPQIGYATDSNSVTMTEHSLSDQVGFGVQYAMSPLGDARLLSHTALTWASLLDAEKSHLFGRGTTAQGFSGALAAPTGVALAASAAGAGQTGNTADIATLYVYVCAMNGRSFGSSGPATAGLGVASTVVSSTALSATTGDVITVAFNAVAGAVGYAVFAGTATGIANAYFCGTTSWAGGATPSFTINFTGGGTGGCPNSGAQPPTADASALTADYDGVLTVAANPSLSGYTKALGGALSTTSPGTEIETALTALFGQGTTNRFADPDVAYMTTSIRRAQGDALVNTSGPNYRLQIDRQNGMTMGTIVTGILNPASGRVLPFEVHPYMPAGNILLQSFHLPMPDSRVPNPVEFLNVQPFMLIDWTNIQLSYDASTYWFSGLCHYAPAWSGSITGIND